MPVWAIVLLVIIAILVVALVALIIVGNKLRKSRMLIRHRLMLPSRLCRC